MIRWKLFPRRCNWVSLPLNYVQAILPKLQSALRIENRSWEGVYAALGRLLEYYFGMMSSYGSEPELRQPGVR